MQLNKQEIDTTLSLIKDVEFKGDFKINHAMARNERKLKKTREAMAEDIKNTETPEDRVKAVVMSDYMYYNLEEEPPYYIKQDPKADELTIRQAFLHQLFAENPKRYEKDISDEQGAISDILKTQSLITQIEDVVLPKETAFKVVFNIIEMMKEERRIRESEQFDKLIQRNLERRRLELSLYQKTKDGELKLDDNNKPILKDEEKANKKLSEFDKKQSNAQKEFVKWLEEPLTLSYTGISLDELPEDLTKKNMEVLIEFISE